MTKFDQLISELVPTTTNGANNTTTTNPANVATQAKPGQPNNPNQQQTTQPNKPTPPTTSNNQQKPNFDQLMKDFNDPNKKINSLADLKNYGINVDQK